MDRACFNYPILILIIRSNVLKGIRRGFLSGHYHISIVVSYIFRVGIHSFSIVKCATIDLKLDRLNFAKIEGVARIEARYRVHVLWCVLFLASLIERRVSHINIALLLKSCQTHVIIKSLSAVTDLPCDIFSFAFVYAAIITLE